MNNIEDKDKNEFKVIDPSNNFHIDITVTFPDTEYIMDIIVLDNGSLIVSTYDYFEKTGGPTKLFYKVVKLSKDSYTMNSYMVQEGGNDDSNQLYLYAIQDNKFASISLLGNPHIWNGEPFSATPLKVIEEKTKEMIMFKYSRKGNLLLLAENEPTIIKVLDLNTYQFIQTMNDISYETMYPIDEKKLLLIELNSNKSKFLYYDTGKKEDFVNINNCQAFLVLRDGNYLCQCDKNKFIVYDVNNSKWSMKICHDNYDKAFYKMNEESFATVDSNCLYIWNY